MFGKLQLPSKPSVALIGISELDVFTKAGGGLTKEEKAFAGFVEQKSPFADFTKGTGAQLGDFTKGIGARLGSYTGIITPFQAGVYKQFEELKVSQGFGQAKAISQREAQKQLEKQVLGVGLAKGIGFGQVTWQAIGVAQAKAISQAEAIKQLQKQLSLQTVKQLQKQLSLQTVGMKQLSAQASLTKQAEAQRQLQKQLSLTKVQPRGVAQPRVVSAKAINLMEMQPLKKEKIAKPKIPWLWLPPTAKPSKPSRLLGYQVLVRGKGKKIGRRWAAGAFTPVSIGVLPKAQALALGQAIPAGTAKRSFKLVPAFGVPAPATKLPAFRPEMFYQKGRTFIEKTRFAIDLPGEFKEITQKGLAAKKQKRLLGIKPFKIFSKKLLGGA